MNSELNQLHEVLIKPVLAARKYLNASKLVDTMLDVGLAVTTQQAPSQVLVKLTDLSIEVNKLVADKPDWCQTHLDAKAVGAAFDAAVLAAHTVIVPAKPGKPKGEPTPADKLQAKCKKK